MKRTKKLLSLLLTVALVLTIVPFSGISVSAYDAPLLNSDGYYEISTADHLYWFAEYANEWSPYINGILMNDIVVNEGDLSGYNGTSENTWIAWTPIGNYDDLKYRGTFDGAGYSITGLYFNDSTVDFVGLFGYVIEGTIKNVSVENSYFYAGGNVGGVCGYVSNGTIENCFNTSTIISNTSGYVSGNCGGICGRIYEGTIKECYNTGLVNNISDYVLSDSGGICGSFSDGIIENCFNDGTVNATGEFGITGGIVGECSNSIVRNTYNTGDVLSEESISGGIVGNNVGSTIEDCYNEGNVSGYSWVGGIVGTHYTYNVWDDTGDHTYGGNISNCYNKGGIVGNRFDVGGIAGQVEEGCKISECYNIGNVTAGEYMVGGIAGIVEGEDVLISNCYNTGNVVGPCYAGSIVGKGKTSVTQNCYYLINSAIDYDETYQNGVGGNERGVVTTDVEGSTTAKTAEEFASGEVAYLLNDGVTDGTQAWHQNINNGEEVDTAPKFVGGTVLKFVKGVETVYSNVCLHNFVNGICEFCEIACEHSYENGVCTICEKVCEHSWVNGTCCICETNLTGIVDNHLYLDGVMQKAYQLVEIDGDFYYIGDRHEIVKNKTVYLREDRINGLTYADGTPIEVGYYDFGEDGKMIMREGLISDKIYKNNTLLKAYQLVEVDGDFYYIGDRHQIVKNKKVYIKEGRLNGLTYQDGTPITAGTYEFDENGKMVILNGLVGDNIYKNNVQLKAYQLVEVDGDFYYIGDRHQIVKNKKVYIKEERINGLTFADGTPITAGYYDFDADGKMVILNGIVDNKVYKNNVQLKGCQLVEVDGDFYYIGDSHEIAKDTVIYLNKEKINGLTYVDGTPITTGFYLFGEDGKMIID